MVLYLKNAHSILGVRNSSQSFLHAPWGIQSLIALSSPFLVFILGRPSIILALFLESSQFHAFQMIAPLICPVGYITLRVSSTCIIVYCTWSRDSLNSKEIHHHVFFFLLSQVCLNYHTDNSTLEQVSAFCHALFQPFVT